MKLHILTKEFYREKTSDEGTLLHLFLYMSIPLPQNIERFPRSSSCKDGKQGFPASHNLNVPSWETQAAMNTLKRKHQAACTNAWKARVTRRSFRKHTKRFTPSGTDLAIYKNGHTLGTGILTMSIGTGVQRYAYWRSTGAGVRMGVQ